MADQPSRDEKGLTLSGRTMLRILIEFGKALTASRKLGEEGSFKLLLSPTILLELRALLWLSSGMAKRIGSIKEVETYLQAHAEEDETVVLSGMKDMGREMLDEILTQGGISKCTTCGQMVCPVCRECHGCNKSKHHDLGSNPFAPPGKGAPN